MNSNDDKQEIPVDVLFLRSALTSYAERMGKIGDHATDMALAAKDPQSVSMLTHAIQTSGQQQIEALTRLMAIEAGTYMSDLVLLSDKRYIDTQNEVVPEEAEEFGE